VGENFQWNATHHLNNNTVKYIPFDNRFILN
jgi:hypothetical protein